MSLSMPLHRSWQSRALVWPGINGTPWAHSTVPHIGLRRAQMLFLLTVWGSEPMILWQCSTRTKETPSTIIPTNDSDLFWGTGFLYLIQYGGTQWSLTKPTRHGLSNRSQWVVCVQGEEAKRKSECCFCCLHHNNIYRKGSRASFTHNLAPVWRRIWGGSQIYSAPLRWTYRHISSPWNMSFDSKGNPATRTRKEIFPLAPLGVGRARCADAARTLSLIFLMKRTSVRMRQIQEI